MDESTNSTHKPRLLNQVRQVIREKHYSPCTEEVYIHWIQYFILFRNNRHKRPAAGTNLPFTKSWIG
ncbi:MAG: hypothetical protein GXO76_05465 [Calditrichaeota bacterium]|nr:hypothetical protein [Calditrichota bacterium]